MAISQLRIAMPENLVDGARNLPALDMGAFNIVGRTDQGTGHRLDPVTMNQHQIWLVFNDEIGKPQHGLGQDHILWVARPLIEKLMYSDVWQPLHLEIGQSVAVHHMHAGNKKRHLKAMQHGGARQRLYFTEIGAGSSDKQKALILSHIVTLCCCDTREKPYLPWGIMASGQSI